MQDRVDEKIKDDERRATIPHSIAGSSLYKSLGEVMAAVRRLDKTEKNQHGKYEFTPADSFRDFIREQFVKNELVYAISETYSSQAGEGLKAGVIKFQYEFWITHIGTGETTPKELRSVFLPYVGSQTAGIASTFALKEWLKNKFLITTGEPDPESKMGEHDERAGEKLTMTESEELAGVLSDALEILLKQKPDTSQLEGWKDDNKELINQLQNAHFSRLKSTWAKHWKAAKETEKK